MATIHAPSDFTGTTYIGPLILNFTDGVADYDGELPEGVRQYLAMQGYGVDEGAPDRPADPEPPDPRDVDVALVGTPLRDAAVDPHPEDFLPPVNAGEANPHGPEVAAPGLHAVGPKPIHPGPVGVSGDTSTPDTDASPNVVKDTDAQGANESALAEAVLVDQQQVGDAIADAAAVDPVNSDAKVAAYDPAGYTVDQVNEYLEKATDAERVRVFAAEADGKNRVGILHGPHAETDD